ncbi:MAG: hypothetical protein EBT45_02605 [Alphaproteobacteria bacterium]|nr:hypothetical protein [Alphaproteobacteria bacterium]
MKKYVKLLTFLLSSSYLVDINSSFAGDRDLVPAHPGGVARHEGRAPDGRDWGRPVAIPASSTGLVAAENLEFGGTQIGHSREGAGYSISVFRAAGGAEIGVAVPEASADSAAFTGSQRLHQAASRGTIPGDLRTQNERDTDTNFVWAYRELAKLYKGLNDFATGQIEDDLNKLSKAVKKVKPDGNALMDQALALAPKLIRKIKTEGETIKATLGEDLFAILQLLRILDEHCQTYIDGRINLTPEVKLKDVLLPEDPRTEVSVERVNTTEIREAFIEVERTLNCIAKDKLMESLQSIDDFLTMAQRVDRSTEHGQNILALSQRFLADEQRIADIIKEKWKSPGQARFEPFRRGVIQLNMLIEHITDYVASAKKIADGTYAHLLAAPEAVAAIEDGSASSSSAVALRQKAAAGGSSALTVGGGMSAETIARLLREKEAAESKLRHQGLADFQAKIMDIRDYLDGKE